MGIFDELDLGVRDMNIDEDFRILLYTDGLTEARDKNRKQFGIKRLRELLPQTAEMSCEKALETILASVNEHTETSRLNDDVALVIIERRM